MASIQRHRSGYRVQVYANGVRDSKVCATRAAAAQWALMREGELTGKRLPDKTLTEALRDYASKVAPTHRGSRW